MATYKQRTPYQRHTAVYSDDEDPQTLLVTGSSTKLPSSTNLNSYHSHLHQHHSSSSNHLLTEDNILENTSDREWTSLRNSTASARAKARQQQYLDQQQQRTREWQFVLSQSFHSNSPPTTTTRDITSDDYDLLSGTETPSVITSPHATDAAPGVPGTVNGELPTFLGYSDLTSDGLESVVESEDWSRGDYEDPMLLSTPAFHRLPSPASPLAASSTTSLNNLPRPSFAASSSYQSINEPKFQNQMPFHDGSGNFFEAQSNRSNLESDVESDRGWESSSSRASSMINAYHAIPNPVGRRMSSSEFKAVIQNIADLQHTTSRQPIMQQRTRQRGMDSGYYFSSASDSRPHFTYPNVVTKRPIFNIYESDMEDMAAMVLEKPTKISWMQAFEKAMTLLNTGDYDVHSSDSTMQHPIKALTQHLLPEEETSSSEKKEFPISSSSSSPESIPPESDSVTDQATLQQVKQNMAAASLETMTRLQTRKRSNPHRRYSSDPMQVEFTPTVRERTMYEDVQRKERRTMSRSTGTSTSMSDNNLLAVVISTLRRFRDHVKSNILYSSEFYDEEERQTDLARSLGLDGDLGIEWSTNGATRREGGRTTNGLDNSDHVGSSSTTLERPARRHERTPSFASSSRSSSRQNVRRVGSDCGLESMKHYRSRESHHSIHSSHYRPSLVE